MTKLTLEERRRSKIRRIEEQIAKRKAIKEQIAKRHAEIYQMCIKTACDYEEVALKLNYNVETVKNIYYKIRKKIREDRRAKKNQDD